MSLNTSPGFSLPYGASIIEKGTNFSLYSGHASSVDLCLFQFNREKKQAVPLETISLDSKQNKTGHVWHILIHDLPEKTLYSYRINHSSQLLLDPYSKAVATGNKWGEKHSYINELDKPGEIYTPLGIVVGSSFDWQNDAPPFIPFKDLILYEMHVRGFTMDPSSKTQHPGTFSGIIEKIPYLKEMGINAIELMPICEFNELEFTSTCLKIKRPLYNYWGYSTVNFFSPMSRYGWDSEPGSVVQEFKTLVRELHKNGIEVFLDMVFNHTAEGGPMIPPLSYRGIENSVYYMVNKEQQYMDFTGCGNTFNSNHPICAELILDCLRYWVTEMHVDGFRFDLASALTRGIDGTPLGNPLLIDLIGSDPILAHTKLIAEPWDVGGLYQVGEFPLHKGRWAEWNGKYRDCARKFIKGYKGKEIFASRLCGSQDLYGAGRAPYHSINFITAHDGFTLADLVSYNHKHNLENGENNRDGLNENDSWNCGVEGVTDKKEILFLRQRQMKNYHMALMVSQGVPMLLMGDEYAHTKNGNNNTYCHDNSLNWFLWENIEKNQEFFRFYSLMNNLRKKNPLFRQDHFLGPEEIEWHGILPQKPLWNQSHNFVAFTLKDREQHHNIYIAFNASNKSPVITFPKPPAGMSWHMIINTSLPSPNDFVEEDQSKPFTSGALKMGGYSAVLFIAK